MYFVQIRPVFADLVTIIDKIIDKIYNNIVHFKSWTPVAQFHFAHYCYLPSKINR